MYKIAIVDDEIERAYEIERYVNRYMKKEEIDVITETYRDGNKITKTSVLYDLVFLDIEMPEINGIELARKIRRTNHKLHIVYITNFAKYRDAAFLVHAYGYLEKPVNKEKLAEILKDFLTETRDKKEIVTLKLTDGSNYFEDVSNICYFEYDGNRKVRVHMFNKEYIRISTSMSYLKKEYQKYGFASPHKSFLVNLERVRNVDMKESLLILDNGVKVSVAQKKQKEFQSILSEYYHNRLENK